MNYIISGKVKGGQFVAFEPEKYRLIMTTLQDESCVYCKFVPKRPLRSNQQNNYYWDQLVEALANEFGYLKEEMHNILKWKFNSYSAELPNGEVIRVAKSTTMLTTTEFMDYIEKIRNWAQFEHNIFIPEPNNA